jgi:hypothetical protein
MLFFNYKFYLTIMKNKILLTILCFFVYKSHFFAQPANYTGTWVLNLEKSKLESKPNGLTGSIFIIKQEGDKFSLKRYHVFGKKKRKISFSMVADGKTRRVKLIFKGKLEQKENGLQATLSRTDFLNIVNYKFGTSQNEFIAEEVFTSSSHNHHNIWVFDKDNS